MVERTTMKRPDVRGIAPALILSWSLLAFTAPAADAPPSSRPVPAAAETEPSLQDDGNDVAFWLHPTDPARSLVLGSAGTAGLEIYDLGGKRVGRYDTDEVDYVDVLYGFAIAGRAAPLVVAFDRRTGSIRSYVLDTSTATITPVSGTPLTASGEVTGLCGYRSALTGRYYVFASVEGSLQQWSLSERDGRIEGRMTRTVPVGTGAGPCAVDEVSGNVYVAEETVGIWRLAAEPETDSVRTAVDLVAPRGQLAEEVKGLAVYRVDASRGYLLGSDAAAGSVNVYSLEDGALLGRFAVGAGDGIDGIEETESLAVTPLALDGRPGGMFAIVDEDNDGAPMNFKLVPWRAIASTLGLATAAADVDPRTPAAPTARAVEPSAETVPVDTWGDAADDPAIWVHPTDTSRSLVIGTNKKQGLDVYDLSGQRVQQLPDGRMNNVDMRDGFRLGGREVTLVTASNRTTKSVSIYALDPATGRLSDVAAELIPTGLADPYGLCMYHDRRRDRFYVFINDGADGAFRQWRLYADGDKVRAERVRDFAVGSETEGCVADDETGALYVGEEDVALWRYSADPKGGSTRRMIDSVEGGRLTDDVEGIALYLQPKGKGYLVVSSQGSDDYVIYRREGDNEYVGRFSIAANDELGIDGASETDGLDVSSAPLGAAFPNGLLVVQDGRNITPAERQNFKFVSWQKIAEALGLPL
jgi:3-phytase